LVKRNSHYRLAFQIFSFIIFLVTKSQNPNFFLYNNDNGLPGNEVYSITKDNKGFIWLGSDAGLFKFDGVRFYYYYNPKQKSRSVNGLCAGSDNVIFCYNFLSQLFFLENDSLKEINHSFEGITNIDCDSENNLYVNHKNGFAVLKWKSKNWANYSEFGVENKYSWKYITRSVSVVNNKKVYFLTTSGIACYENGIIKSYENNLFKNFGISKFMLISHLNDLYLSISETGTLYKFSDGQYDEISDEKLSKLLSTKKINNVKILPDKNLWICTYNGIFCYNFNNKTLKSFYEELSFSDCLIDREGNYWFSSLQSGVLRINNLEQSLWNNLRNNRIEYITGDSNIIYFSPSTSHIGQLDVNTNNITYYDITGEKDIQCFNYNTDNGKLYFYTNQNLYVLFNKKTEIVLKNCMPIKHVLPMDNELVLSSSFGTYIFDINKKIIIQKLHEKWSRQSICNVKQDKLWIATNNGLLIYNRNNEHWGLIKNILTNNQIISIDIDKKNNKLYVISFNGDIYSVDENENFKLLTSLPKNAKPNSLKIKNKKLYITSNYGLWIFDLSINKWNNINTTSGIASNGVQQLLIVKNHLYLATKKGIQKISADIKINNVPSLIYLKNNHIVDQKIKLKHNEVLTLFPELNHYSSNGMFQYAYRINENEWVHLPSSIEKIEIQNIPSGDFSIWLKGIDSFGNDSANTLKLSGYMPPPFWKAWWFIILLLSFLFSILYFSIKFNFNKRQLKLKQLNELNNSKLTAIRSQMNPHFIFNSLNSIQDLILKGDVENSYSYLTSFSSLVRKILNYSDKDFIDFEQEIKLLEIYLSLEKLRFKKDFHYIIQTNGVEDIQIPPMLIQPFIENAILHGLLHKEGEKRLMITFRIDEVLICEIEDNGIGREKSKQIKERQKKVHQSFSGEATKRRFALLSALFNKKYEYFFHDLTNGTKVTLHIPFKRKF
jgi:ligand-binding sensor domain-containing protein